MNPHFEMLLRWARRDFENIFIRGYLHGFINRDAGSVDALLEPWQAEYVINILTARQMGISA